MSEMRMLRMYKDEFIKELASHINDEKARNEYADAIENSAIEYNHDIEEVFEKVIDAVTKLYPPYLILMRYNEQPIHLEYMAGNPMEVFKKHMYLDEVDDRLFDFVLDNKYLSLESMLLIADTLHC